MLTSAAEIELANAVADLEHNPLALRILRVVSNMTFGSARELAERLGAAEPAVFTVLEDLAVKGLLNRVESNYEVLFSLTPIGTQALEIVEQPASIVRR